MSIKQQFETKDVAVMDGDGDTHIFTSLEELLEMLNEHTEFHFTTTEKQGEII